jgi:hypothetical protein
MNYAKAFEDEYARLIHAGPRPKPKGPKYYGITGQILDIMSNGREHTSGDISAMIGCSTRTASFWLGRLSGPKSNKELESSMYRGGQIYWLAGSKAEGWKRLAR